MIIRARIVALAFLIATVAMLGCQSGSQFPAKVSGKVTYGGATVGGGTIAFYAPDGKVYATEINPDGTYVVENISEGTFEVTIETESINPEKKTEQYKSAGGGLGGMYGKSGGGVPKFGKGAPKEGAPKSPMPSDSVPSGGTPATYVKIPPKYKEKSTSGLSVTLKKGNNTENFDLKD
jgi:hypothetical protein